MSAYSFAQIICQCGFLQKDKGAGVSFCRTDKFPEEALEYCRLQPQRLSPSEAQPVTRRDSDHMSSSLVLSSPVSPHSKATDSLKPRSHLAIS